MKPSVRSKVLPDSTFDEFFMNSSSIERFSKTDHLESRNKSEHTIYGFEAISLLSIEHGCVCIYIEDEMIFSIVSSHFKSLAFVYKPTYHRTVI